MNFCVAKKKQAISFTNEERKGKKKTMAMKQLFMSRPNLQNWG